ncbi:MAG TPA: SusC/RagA family TonB-linked outer membrane protein [Longimicrobiales bacterium]
MSLRKSVLSWLGAGAAVLLMASTALGQTGTISGQVTDEATGAPLVGVQVAVVGTNLSVGTNENGRYLILNVPAGEHQVRASLIGYGPQSATVTVRAGETAAQNFALQISAIELASVVVTATGEQQQLREIGSSVGVINVEDVALAPVQSMSDLLQGRSAGMTVLKSSGGTGTGSRIRIRGSNSISLSNEPLLVIDGVRVDNDPTFLGFGVGGQQPSRFNDLNPENIESIEILKGPAASALYGTAAANGVIQVTTKKGRAGAPQFRAWAELGRIENVVDFPTNHVALDAGGNFCPVFVQAQGACTPVETYQADPLDAEATSPYTTGNFRTLGASVSGGSNEATYYVSGEVTTEDGVYDDGESFGEGFDDMDDLRRINVRANLTGRLSDKLSLGSSVGFVETDLELPQADNALFGIIGMGLTAAPTPEAVENNFGYESPPQAHYDWITSQDVSRFTGSITADWRPVPWLSVHGTGGLDRTATGELNRIPRESFYNIFGGIYSEGWIQRFDYDIYRFDSNVSGTATFEPIEGLVSTTTVGSQYLREDFSRIYAFGATLLPGVETSLAGATTDFSTGEDNILNSTLSAYAQQRFGWQDRVFVNFAVRGDQNTAFGTDIGWIWYPSVSSSWVISEESFFPETPLVSTLRLRAAYGQAGLRPGATDALLSFSGEVGVLNNEPVPAFTIDELGNLELKPERSTEWELGFESGFLDDKLGLDVTYFSKSSRDALVDQPLPGSPGGSDSRWVNLARVDNSGLEVLLRGQPVRTDRVQWDFTVSASWIKNELVDLGNDAQGEPIPPIIFGLRSTQRHAEGHPLGSWFQRPIEEFSDANGDGMIEPDEVVLGDSAQFLGSPFPSREVSLGSSVYVSDWLRISALFDYRGGFELIDFTGGWRCALSLSCADAYDANAPLEKQAAIAALAEYGTWAGFVEDADFVKFRELSVTLNVPQEFARRIGSDGLSLTLAGRNLATWTGYSGLDPEVSFQGQANFTSGEFFTLPPTRAFTLRVDANF